MTDNLSDSQLLNRCIDGGDKAAWEAFVKKFSRLIWNSIHKTFSTHFFSYSREDAEDMYSSVFLSLVDRDFNKLKQFRGDNACTLSTWLSIITVRMTIDYMRRDKRHMAVNPGEEDREIWDVIPDNRYRADTLVEEKQADEHLKKSIDLLSVRDRLIYDLLHNKGFSPEETAETLKLPVSIVYSRKHRIIEKIKKNIDAL
jgi:RNA polymerase sigma-70 factor (ECF subfamily)